jgi:hypothetical protein
VTFIRSTVQGYHAALNQAPRLYLRSVRSLPLTAVPPFWLLIQKWRIASFISVESRPAMTRETLENFLFLLLWIEVFAMAIGLLLLDRSMSRK